MSRLVVSCMSKVHTWPSAGTAHSNENMAMMKACMLKASPDSRDELEGKAEFEPCYVNGAFSSLDLCEKMFFSVCLFQCKFRVSQSPGLLLRSAIT